MFRQQRKNKTKLRINESVVAENIEDRVRRLISDKAPIDEGAPLIYTEKKDGVQPEYDIRTDKMTVLTETVSKAQKAIDAKRQGAGKKKTIEENPPELDGINSSLEE